MSLISEYLRDVHFAEALKGTEGSYYNALGKLFNAAGEGAEPPIRCMMELKDLGAGFPDGGLYTYNQIPDTRTPLFDDETDPPKPSRGAIEVKEADVTLDELQEQEQVERYLSEYRTTLITNLRAFRLLQAGKNGEKEVVDEFTLAGSEQEFREIAARAEKPDKRLEKRFESFISRVIAHGAPLVKPEDVARLLASYAREAKVRLENSNLDNLDRLKKEVEKALGVDYKGKRGERFFQSTIIQTLFYGIFSAWVLWHRKDPERTDKFDWTDTDRLLRVPVLQTLFYQLTAPGKLVDSNVRELMKWAGQTLGRVDRSAFFERFSKEEAIQYFYEPFLEAFDPKLRDKMGVWYTPSEIVKYQVRHVDAVLEEKLEISGGLANDRVKILDPCCGTGAYLMETLNVIEERFRKRDEDGLAPAEMKKAAMSRIYGFEILTAPFVVSHLQLGLKLAESGAPLEAKNESDDSSKAERVGVYLTNALTGWKPPDNPQEILFPRLEKEREEAEAIKQEEEILVILGNPPYDGYADIATKDEERALSDAYRESPEDVPDPKGQGLNNPYVRFFRMAERQITEHTGQGIVCYISNYRWLDGSSHSGMRARYLEEFDQVWIDNLHGDRKASERNPEGLSSQTIFAREGQSPGIENGVAISLLCRRSGSEKRCAVRYRDFHQADAEERRKALLESLSEKNREQQYTKHDPSPELGLPLDPNQIAGDYLNWPSLPDLFLKAYPGIQTCRSSVVVDIDKEDLLDRMKAYFNPEVSHEEMKEIKPEAMESSDDDFDPEKTREALIERGFSPENIVRYCYRPMDIRWLYWEPQTDLLDREREDLVSNIFEDNVCLSAATSHRRGYDPPLTTHEYGSRHIIERGAHLFPLYLTQGGGGAKLETTERGLFDKVVPNLTERASSYLSGLGLGAETLFYHTIATLHSPRYQREHEDALENDWPRVPLPEDSNLLHRSAELGREITALLNTERSLDGVDSSGKIRDELHLLGRLERVGTDKPVNPNVDLAVTAGWGYTIPPSTVVPNKGEIERRSYTPDEEAGLPWQGHEQWGGETLDIYLNDNTRWTNVPKRVWNYTLGGYPVIKKWLSYREKDVLGRDLNYDEAQHVTSMVRRIAALLLLEPSLDDSYEDVKKVA